MRRLACDWGYTDAKFKQEKHYRMEPAPQVEASQQMMGARLRPERANTKGDGGQEACEDIVLPASPGTAKRPGRANTVYSDGGQNVLTGPVGLCRIRRLFPEEGWESLDCLWEGSRAEETPDESR